MAERTTCLVVGGGPAGMVTGLLLARGGVAVTVLEKYDDFFRDFRGDTIHPSTLQLLDELGLGAAMDAVPHHRVSQVKAPTGAGGEVTVVDFGRLPHRRPYVAMAPQWDFLDLLARAAREEATFELRMGTEVTDLLRDDGRVVGVRYRGAGGEGEIRADLCLACDGRWSTVRRLSGLPLREFPVGLDVWWFRLDSATDVGDSLLPRVTGGKPFIVIPRSGYAQVAHLIRKGTDAALRARGLAEFRADVARALPELAVAAGRLTFDDVRLLDVQVNRLRRWWAPGLLCIGDAAHAMSPVGGVGVNLAVQDGVAAASRLAGPLRAGRVTDVDLAAVQRRRALPAILTQFGQRLVHRVIDAALGGHGTAGVPAPVARLLRAVPALTVVPAVVVGVGIRPEHAPRFARPPSPPAAARGRARPFPAPSRRRVAVLTAGASSLRGQAPRRRGSR